MNQSVTMLKIIVENGIKTKMQDIFDIPEQNQKSVSFMVIDKMMEISITTKDLKIKTHEQELTEETGGFLNIVSKKVEKETDIKAEEIQAIEVVFDFEKDLQKSIVYFLRSGKKQKVELNGIY